VRRIGRLPVQAPARGDPADCGHTRKVGVARLVLRMTVARRASCRS
jgi:hypothetical protein